MSTTIDSKVVEMRFDNKNFEQNIQTSLGSLEKLKQSLNLEGAAKSLQNVDAAAKGVNMSMLGSAVETVQAKFSALQVMAVTALANITNSAVNAGKRIVSALTIDPIKTGLSEYETKINAIQTIMSNTSNKGTTMDDVTRVLGELNTYADKTIYNFAEMTRNIGTFTAAGIGLEESASAIQGIANLAAASGSTSQQASTAMYQLSQAMSSGTVKLMDWNSVVNAGMGGQKFQDALKATARDHGIAVDEMIEENGSFRDSLQEGWISAEILSETLSKFTVDGAKKYAKSMMDAGKWTQAQADALIKEAEAMNDAATKVKTFTQLWDTLKESAQSGWSQTWEIIIGDFEEAKETLTKFSDVIGGMIGKAADARNELLQGWKDAGGRADLVDSIFNIFNAVLSVVKPIKEAFREIFPPLTVEQLVRFTSNLKEFTAKLTISGETADKLKRTFKGLFAVLGIVADVFSAVFKVVGSLFGSVTGLSGGILEVTATIGDWLVALREAIRNSKLFSFVFEGIGTTVKVVVNILKGAVDFLGSIFSGVGDLVSSMTGSFDSAGASLENNVLVRALKGIFEAVKYIASGIIKAVVGLVTTVSERLGAANFGEILDLINSVIAGGVGISIIKFFKDFKSGAEGITGIFGKLSGLVDGLSDVFGGLAGVLEGYQSKLKADALIKIATAIAILAGSLLVISLIDSDKLYDSIVAISTLFAALAITMRTMSKAGDVGGSFKATTTILGVSLAVLVLAGALKTVSAIKPEQLISSLLGVAALLAMVVGTMKLLEGSSKKAMKGALQIVIFAAAIKILASACIDLAALSWEGLFKGLVGVGVLIAAVDIFLNTAKFSGKAVLTATGIVLLAAAIKILASACADFAQMKGGDIAKSLTTIAVLLGEIVAFTKLTGNAKHVISTGIALIAIAAAVKIFASAMIELASLSLAGIAKGLVALAVALALIVATMKFMPKDLIGVGVGLIAVAAAVLIISNALTKLGKMSLAAICKSMIALSGAMAILAIGLNKMTGTLSGSAAILVAAVAIGILAPALALLGSMSVMTIVKSLAALAGVLAVMGVAAMLLTPVVPIILALAGAFALIGVGALALGAGLVSIGTGIMTIIAAIGLLVKGVGDFVIGLVNFITAAVVAICRVIIECAPDIAKALIVLVKVICQVLVECVPVIADAALKLILGVLDALTRNMPQVVGALFDLIVGIIRSLAEHVPELIVEILKVFAMIGDGVVKAIQNLDPDEIMKILTSVGMMAGIMAALNAVSPMAAGALAGVAAMAKVIAALTILLTAIGAISLIPGLEWIIKEGGKLLEAIGEAIGGLVGGLIAGIGKAVTSALPQMAKDLSNFMKELQPFLDGAKLIDPKLPVAIGALMSSIMMLAGATITNSAANLGSTFMDAISGFLGLFTGKSDEDKVTTVADSFEMLGKAIRRFNDQVVGVDFAAVTDGAKAGQLLLSLTAGKNLFDYDKLHGYASGLRVFGEGLKAFSDSVIGLNVEAVSAATEAARGLAEMSQVIPNEGGMVAWFKGDNSIATFANQLPALGNGLKSFSDSVVGLNGEAISAATAAAKGLAEMSQVIPNEGGMIAWFKGDNSIAGFADQLPNLGKGLKSFSESVAGLNTESISAATGAAKALAEMTSVIPNQGGVVAWFTGDNSIAKFGTSIVALGKGLKGFAESTAGINTEAITAAAGAAKAIASITNVIPNEGGMVAWFTGENSLSKFGSSLISLGKGLKGFAESTAGINAEAISAAAGAAKALASVTNVIPNQGGVVAWFTGENSLSKFGKELLSLGRGLKGFAESTAGINTESMTSAAGAAKTLAEMTSHIPNQGGVVAWFTGENSLAMFGKEIAGLGKGLKGFSDAVTGINPENVTSAAGAAKALAQMASYIPNQGGVVAWFTGENSIAKFGSELKTLGKGLKGFSDAVVGINPENVTSAANAAKSLAKMAETAPSDCSNISAFGTAISKFGPKLASYFKSVSEVSAGAISASGKVISAVKKAGSIKGSGLSSAAEGIKALSKAVKGMSGISEETTSGFVKAMKNLSKVNAAAIAESFSSTASKIRNVGKEMVKALSDGIISAKGTIKTAAETIMDTFATSISKSGKPKTACLSMVTKCSSSLLLSQTKFFAAGSNLAIGFANGISSSSFAASVKATAMANAAAKAAKRALDEHSPSRVGYGIGAYFGQGFVNAIADYADRSYKVGSEMANAAKYGLNDSISKISDLISSDVDTQPTIRPVMDLSDIKSGVNTLGGMLNFGSSVGVLSNVGAVSAMMNRRNQNGGTAEVVSAIEKLNDNLGKTGNTSYSIGGITYDDGSNIAEAIRIITRAALKERRV